jgi:hypothetical protein
MSNCGSHNATVQQSDRGSLRPTSQSVPPACASAVLTREPIRQRTKVRSKRGPDDQRSQRLRKQALDVL